MITCTWWTVDWGGRTAFFWFVCGDFFLVGICLGLQPNILFQGFSALTENLKCFSFKLLLGGGGRVTSGWRTKTVQERQHLWNQLFKIAFTGLTLESYILGRTSQMAGGRERERGAWKCPKYYPLVTSCRLHQLVPPSDRILLHMVSSLKLLPSRRGYEGHAHFVLPPMLIYFDSRQDKKIFWFFLVLFLQQFVGKSNPNAYC